MNEIHRHVRIVPLTLTTCVFERFELSLFIIKSDKIKFWITTSKPCLTDNLGGCVKQKSFRLVYKNILKWRFIFSELINYYNTRINDDNKNKA